MPGIPPPRLSRPPRIVKGISLRLLYSLVVYLLQPFLFGYFLWRSRLEPDYRRRWRERLGFIGRRAPGSLWLHAASVGETQAALPLIELLLRRYPERRLVVTSFTPTGAALLRDRLGDRVENVYLPVDTPGAVARFLNRLRPQLGIIIETELWPNLLQACRHRAIPMLLASATLSDASLRRYLRFPGRRLMHAALRAFEVIAVQSREDADRFRVLGVHPGRIEITGNIKFDLELQEGLGGRAMTLRHDWTALSRPVWVAASTHEGEEQIAINAFAALAGQFPDQLLVLVPRHPQRFDAVAALLESSGLIYVRRSRQAPVNEATQVVLIDTLGELMLFYALADVAFVGGSLVPIGGHNLLEPAALARPVLSGPHYESQQQLFAMLEKKQAIRCVTDESTLQQSLGELLASTQQRQAMGQAAQRVVMENRGALARVQGAVTRIMVLAAGLQRW